MSITPMGVSVAGVTQMNAGADIRKRRLAIGMSVTALAKLAGVDRGRLKALEAGEKVRDTTMAAVVKALSDREHELGIDLPSQVRMVPVEAESHPQVIRFEVQGVYGAKALVVEGPPENIAELEEMVDRIMRRLAGEQNGPESV